MAILYFLAEEQVKDDQRQDRFLIVEVHTPDRVDDRWVQQAAENAIERVDSDPIGHSVRFQLVAVPRTNSSDGYVWPVQLVWWSVLP